MKNLLSEISRIKEVMGVKNLIVEGPQDDLIKFIDEVLERVRSTTKERGVDEYKVEGVNIGKDSDRLSFIDNLKLAKTNGLSSLTDEQVELFYTILKKIEGGKFVETEYSNFLTKLESQNVTEYDFLKSIYKSLPENYTRPDLENVLNNYFNSEVLTALYINKIDTKLTDLPEIIKKAEQTKRLIDNGLIDVRAAKIIKNPVYQSALQRSFFRFLPRYVVNYKKNAKEIIDQIDELIGIIAYKTDKNEQFHDEVRKIYDLILNYKKGMEGENSNLKSLFSRYLLDNKIVKYDQKTLDEVLTNSPHMRYIIEQAGKDNATAVSNILITRLLANAGFGRSLANPNENVILTGLKRTGYQQIWGSGLSGKEVQYIISKYGTKTYLSGRLQALALWNFLFVPAVWAALDTYVSGGRVEDMNEEIAWLKKQGCEDTKMFSDEICNSLVPIQKSNFTNFKEAFLRYMPLVGLTQDETNPGSLFFFSRLDDILIFMWNAYQQQTKLEGRVDSEWLKNYFFKNYTLPKEIMDLGYDQTKTAKENYDIIKSKLVTNIPVSVSKYISDHPDENWMPLKPVDYESNKDDYRTIYVNNQTGEETTDPTDATLLYQEITTGSKIKEFWDDVKKQKYKFDFRCLFEEDNELYDKNFEDEGFKWISDDKGNLSFEIKRLSDGTIDRINFVEAEKGLPIRLGDTEEFTCERAKELAGEKTTPPNGNLDRDGAISIGLPSAFYDTRITKFKGTLEKISDNELKFFSKQHGEYTLKKIDGTWYWQGNTSAPVVESKIIKKENMKTLNESIREKLTSKYIDKSKKFIKITENLEKVYPYFEEENYDVFFKKMFKLAEAYKKSKLYINEADEELFSKGLSLLSGQEDMIKEKLVSYISSALSLTEKMKGYIKNEIDSVPNGELGSLFTSPRKVADMIADAVVDQARDSKPTPTDLMSAIEASTIPYFETSEFRRKLVRELQGLIGPKMDEKKGQISQIVKDLLKKAQED